MLLCVGILVLLIFVAGLVLEAFRQRMQPWLPASAETFWGLAQLGTSVALNSLAFALLYRFVPKAAVAWRHALRGGVLAAVVWEAGRQLLASYLIGSKYTNAYGVVGSFLAVMVWMYYANTVLLIGGEYVQVVSRRSTGGAADRNPA
jgi:membrane protein